MEKTEFYPMTKQPSIDESDASFSKTVIVYGQRSNEVALGFFDFEMNEWIQTGESPFLLKCWCYLPDSIYAMKNIEWEIVAPRGYNKFYL